MNIIVCVKQVPDTTDVAIDSSTGTLIREGVPRIVNPDDKHAVEEALRLKEEYGGKVTALTMGPYQAKEALREVYAMGVDETVLLCDRAFAGADTWATAYTLAMAIRKIGDYDIIFCGREALDGDTGQIGPQVADALDIGQVTYVRKVDMRDNVLVVERAVEDGHVVMEVAMPVLLTALKDLNVPRFPDMGRAVEAHREHRTMVWSAEELGADPMKIGLQGSPTKVRRIFAPQPKGKCEMIRHDTVEGQVAILVDRLVQRNVVRKSVA